MTRKYRLLDLKLGMHIRKSEVSEIYDTYIILKNPEHIEGSQLDAEGDILFIGHDLNSESTKLIKELKPCRYCVIFNNFGSDINRY